MGQKTTKGESAPPPLHPELIKARIRMAHGSVAKFEQASGLPRRSVRDVLRGRINRRAADSLAKFLGKPVAELFPGRYIAADYKSPNGDSHRLNAEAA